jgi:2-desacetyl-2-hydroxyethyl bacteriochlorophyllide A dehydrogenase
MRAVRLVHIGQPLEECQVPVPEPDADDVLVAVAAAGICHSDAHYRAGTSPVGRLPITLGHEVAGVVHAVGPQVRGLSVGQRVCVHYMATCGRCHYCAIGQEQFCEYGEMIGKHRDGGYAEYVLVPSCSVVPLPNDIPFNHGAIMMCSSATSLHALRKSRLQPGERVAVFGIGGLGISAVQLARAFGALDVYAVDLDDAKLKMAEQYGAIPVNAHSGDPVAQILDLTDGQGVDVALELIGLPQTMTQGLECLAVFGRLVLVGISARPMQVDTYPRVLGREVQIIGSSDHLLSELPLLFEFALRRALDLTGAITHTVPLDAGQINQVLDALEQFQGGIRTVILP